MKYAKSNTEKSNTSKCELDKMNQKDVKKIRVYGSVVIIKGGSLVDED